MCCLCRLSLTPFLQKRTQALPLRISEGSKRWPLAAGQLNFLDQPAPHSVTPSDSDSEDANAATSPRHNNLQHQQQPFQSDHAPHSQTTFYLEPELDHGEDMDMMMDTLEPSPHFVELQYGEEQQREGRHLQPGSLQPDPIGPPTITGRMPTPIQPSFAAQVRGGCKNWGGAAGNIMSTGPLHHARHSAFNTNGGLHSPQQELAGFPGSATALSLGGASVPRSLDGGMADWNPVQNRRLPSPISEAGGDSENGQSSDGMVMDSTAACDVHHGLQHGLFPHSPPLASSLMEMGGSNMPHVATPRGLVAHGDGSMDVEAVTPSPPRKGHNRSRHTVNNWTQQPGMKKSFSIGYRSDCEKCRSKLPGHFNHIIIS